MQIKDFQVPDNIDPGSRLHKHYTLMVQTVNAVRNREEPSEQTTQFINTEIEVINSLKTNEKALLKQLVKSKRKVIILLEKEHKLVFKDHYRKHWMGIGLASLGIPIGVSFSVALDNYGFIGSGVPIGLVIGMIIGGNMDKKVEEEGRLLTHQ